jgi:hypothetical protein
VTDLDTRSGQVAHGARRRARPPWVAPVLATAAALAGCAYLATHDPNNPSVLMPECPTKLLTGLDCPACGGLRMVRALVTGHWSAAVHDNVVLLAASPFLAYFWLRWLVAGLRGRRYTVTISRRTGFAIMALALVWMLVRNLPGFPLKPGG